MEKDFIKRLQELAGIDKSEEEDDETIFDAYTNVKIFPSAERVDPVLDKLGINDGDKIKLGSEKWVELLSLVYQVPFDGDIEKFTSLIDKKGTEENYGVKNLEYYLGFMDIEIV